jgi:hypothetical protein
VIDESMFEDLILNCNNRHIKSPTSTTKVKHKNIWYQIRESQLS